VSTQLVVLLLLLLLLVHYLLLILGLFLALNHALNNAFKCSAGRLTQWLFHAPCMVHMQKVIKR